MFDVHINAVEAIQINEVVCRADEVELVFISGQIHSRSGSANAQQDLFAGGLERFDLVYEIAFGNSFGKKFKVISVGDTGSAKPTSIQS